MSKLKVVLVGAGALVVAGFVYRKPLRATLSNYSDYAHGFVSDMAEELVQRHQNQALKNNVAPKIVWQDNSEGIRISPDSATQ